MVVVPHFWRVLGPGHMHNFEELAWERELGTLKPPILKDFEPRGCLSRPLNFDQLLNNVSYVFGYNFFNFCPFGASQSPECSFFIDNQFCKFSFCKKAHFCIQFCGKSRKCQKTGKKLVVSVLLIQRVPRHPQTTWKAPNGPFFIGITRATFKSGQNPGFPIKKLKKRRLQQKIPLKMTKSHVNSNFVIVHSILACQRAAKVYNEGF